MTKKDMLIMRKGYKTELATIRTIAGSLVNTNGERVLTFKKRFLSMPEDDQAEYLELFKKATGGKLEKNLFALDIPINVELDPDSMCTIVKQARGNDLDKDTLEKLEDRIIENYQADTAYMIITITDTRDLPPASEHEDDSWSTYSYVMVCVCPLKATKCGIGFDEKQHDLKALSALSSVSAPEFAFAYPALDHGEVNMRQIMYHTRTAKNLFPGVVERILDCKALYTETEQKQAFTNMLEELLGDKNSVETMKNLTELMRGKVEDNVDRQVVEKSELRDMLEESGCDDLNSFDRIYDTHMKELGDVPIDNLINQSKFDLEMSDVTISLNPERMDLVEEQMVDGKRCLVVKLEGHVNINGTYV